MQKPKKMTRVHVGICLLWVALGAWVTPSVWAKDSGYSREEMNLSRPPRARLSDWRLRKIYRRLAKEYRHMYGHAAADGYILPNELRDLKFHRRFMFRLHLIDKRNALVRREYRRLQRHHRIALRCRTRRCRRHRQKQLRQLHPKISQQLARLKKAQIRYERMIRRFSCRYLKQYRRKYRKHCRKSS